MLPILEYRDELLVRIQQSKEQLLLLENKTLEVFQIDPKGTRTDCTAEAISREKGLIQQLQKVANEITATFE